MKTQITEAIQRFPVGTKFIPLTGKSHRKDIHTVVDFLVTRNLAGEVVQSRYVTTHEFMGQAITNCDIVEATIARGEKVL